MRLLRLLRHTMLLSLLHRLLLRLNQFFEAVPKAPLPAPGARAGTGTHFSDESAGAENARLVARHGSQTDVLLLDGDGRQ